MEYLAALGPLTLALAAAQTAAVDGTTGSGSAALSTAVANVTAVDDRLGDSLGSHDRWHSVQAKIAALTGGAASDGVGAYADYGNLTDLVLGLYTRVRETSGLAHDAAADTYYLQDGASRQLPATIVAVGRLADQATLVPGPAQGRPVAYHRRTARRGHRRRRRGPEPGRRRAAGGGQHPGHGAQRRPAGPAGQVPLGRGRADLLDRAGRRRRDRRGHRRYGRHADRSEQYRGRAVRDDAGQIDQSLAQRADATAAACLSPNRGRAWRAGRAGPAGRLGAGPTAARRATAGRRRPRTTSEPDRPRPRPPHNGSASVLLGRLASAESSDCWY